MKKCGKLILILLVTISSLVIVGISVFLFYFQKSKLSLKLNGDDSIILNVNDEYKELGATAKFNKRNINKKIDILGTVDSDVIGKYKIDYSVKVLWKRKNKTRTISVVDTENPVIILKGDKEIALYVGSTYEEPGYEVTDNYDNDLLDKVVVTGTVDTSKIGTYEIVYSITDSSSNSASEKRKIVVKSKPVVTYSSKYGVPVLMYHAFYDETLGEVGSNSNFMEKSDFDDQIKYLTETGYYFPSWEEINGYLDGVLKLPTKSIVVTIDDGNESFFRIAYPILEKYNAKATVFIVTSWTTPDRNKYKEEYLDYQSHSHNMHGYGGCNGITSCGSDANILNDLNTSKNIASATVFCYPMGYYNNHSIELVKQAGYSLAFTTAYGKISPGMNKLALPRIRMRKGVSLNTFKNSI